MVEWFKIKEGKLHRIAEPKDIEVLLNKGFSVTKVYKEGNVEKILSYSPKTRLEAWEHHKKHGIGLF
jgi:hypothetical protein